MTLVRRSEQAALLAIKRVSRAGRACVRKAQTWPALQATSVDCMCADNTLGEFCHLGASGCFLDVSSDCCALSHALALDGTCCTSREALDANALCCAQSDLDACGECGGDGVFVDSMGTCCPVNIADANGACCFGFVDDCGARCTL